MRRARLPPTSAYRPQPRWYHEYGATIRSRSENNVRVPRWLAVREAPFARQAGQRPVAKATPGRVDWLTQYYPIVGE